MRILMGATQPVGGIRTFLRYVYTQPPFADCRITLVAPDIRLKDYLETYLGDRMELIPAPRAGFAFARSISRELRHRSYDLMHAHGFTASFLGGLACLGSGIPKIATGHELLYRDQFRGLLGGIKRRLIGTVLSQYDVVHTVTNDAWENFVESFPMVDRRRVRTILHGVDTEYFAAGEPRDLAAQLGIDSTSPLIGYFGRFMPPKGFRDLVAAMKIVVDNQMMDPLPTVVTFGYGGFIREDYQHLAELGLEHRFIQVQQTDDMPGCLKGVDVVAMPSLAEACGLLAMEALAAGAPIVGTSCRGLKEVLSGTPAMMVPPGEPDALARALVTILTEDRRHEFTIFQAEAVERFSIARPAAELRAVYDRVVSS